MKEISNKGAYQNLHVDRHQKTFDFIKEFISPKDVILDLGPSNPMSELMKVNGLDVDNTSPKTDLDLEFSIIKDEKYNVLTAFQILEHMVSPFPVLAESKATKLFVSVPLKLWFSSAYWNENDKYDRHYHEFEPKQLRMLLEKAGWKIIKEEQWITKGSGFGIRPFLRTITPRHIIVYCER